MPNRTSSRDFHKSISLELVALKNRVRHLIGDAHWGEEGGYKEAVLRNVIRKQLPDDLILGTGFIVREGGGKIKVSSQIDILIIDKNAPVLFREGDFIITTPLNVRGIIEVKTTLSVSDSETIKKATKNGDMVGLSVFNGIFAFDKEGDNFQSKSFESSLKASKGRLNHICYGKNYFVKFWESSSGNPVKNAYSIYKINNYSFTYFIFNLVNHIYPNTYLERGWFLFPIEKGKENYKIHDIYIKS